MWESFCNVHLSSWAVSLHQSFPSAYESLLVPLPNGRSFSMSPVAGSILTSMGASAIPEHTA